MSKYADPKTGQVYDYGTDPSLNADAIKGLVSVPDTTPTGSSVYKPTTLPSGLSGYTDPMGNFSTTLNTESLTPQFPPAFSSAPQDNNNYSGLLSGGQATIDALNKYFTTPPASTADLYNTAYNQSGIEQKQQDVLNAQKTTKQAQAKLAGINAQLAGINAEAQAIPIRLQQQSEGRGITTGGLAPIQTGLLRENALKALPLQAQALGAQAEIATAQGNQELAQKSLEMAQSKLDTIFKIRSQEAENTYNYQKDLRDKVLTYATEAEKVKLQNAQKIADQQFQLYKDKLNNQQAISKKLMQSGQGELASKIGQLDPKSATYNADLAALQKQAQPTRQLSDFEQAFLREKGRMPTVQELTAFHQSQFKPTNEKLTPAEIQQYQTDYPDAGIKIGDTKESIQAKINPTIDFTGITFNGLDAILQNGSKLTFPNQEALVRFKKDHNLITPTPSVPPNPSAIPPAVSPASKSIMEGYNPNSLFNTIKSLFGK